MKRKVNVALAWSLSVSLIVPPQVVLSAGTSGQSAITASRNTVGAAYNASVGKGSLFERLNGLDLRMEVMQLDLKSAEETIASQQAQIEAGEQALGTLAKTLKET